MEKFHVFWINFWTQSNSGHVSGQVSGLHLLPGMFTDSMEKFPENVFLSEEKNWIISR